MTAQRTDVSSGNDQIPSQLLFESKIVVMGHRHLQSLGRNRKSKTALRGKRSTAGAELGEELNQLREGERRIECVQGPRLHDGDTFQQGKLRIGKLKRKTVRE